MLRGKAVLIIAILLAAGPGCPREGGADSSQMFELFLDRLAPAIKESPEQFEHLKLVSSLTWDDENRRLYVGRESGDIEMLDLTCREPEKPAIVRANKRRPDRVLLLLGGKEFLAASSMRDAINLFETRTGAKIHSIPDFTGPMVRVGDDLYVVNKGNRLAFFDARKKLLYPELYDTGGMHRGASVRCLAADEKTGLVAAGNMNGGLDLFQIIFDGPTPQLKKLNGIEPYTRDAWSVQAVWFAADGRSLYSVSQGGHIDQWAAPSLEIIGSVSAELSLIDTAAFRPERNLLALAGTYGRIRGEGVRAVELRDLATGRSTLVKPLTGGVAVEFLPVWDKLLIIHGSEVTSLDLPPSRGE